MPLSEMMVLCWLKVTECSAATMSCTHMSTVRKRSGTTDNSWYDPIGPCSSTGSVSMFPLYRMEVPGVAGRMFSSQ